MRRKTKDPSPIRCRLSEALLEPFPVVSTQSNEREEAIGNDELYRASPETRPEERSDPLTRTGAKSLVEAPPDRTVSAAREAPNETAELLSSRERKGERKSSKGVNEELQSGEREPMSKGPAPSPKTLGECAQGLSQV